MIKKTILTLVSLGLIAAGLGAIWAASLEIPDLGSFDDRVVSQSTKIYDRTGSILLYNIHNDVNRRVVGGDLISRHLKNATVAIEDSEFYEHNGIKPLAILRALLVNISSGEARQGGSTITQQLIKNTVLTKDKTIARKFKEAVLALKIEKQLSKDEILTLYLNEAPYGGNIYGVEEAALNFFNKHADGVSLAEAAYLAAIPQAPTYYSPYGNHREELENRKNLVLDRMVELGFATSAEADSAKTEAVAFQPPNDQGIKAPHFVMWVKDYLENRYGADVLTQQGLKVITTLDWDLQKLAETTVAKFAAENETKFNARNAALVALDPQTGQVLAMVGSRDYFDINNDGNFNVALARRQPGSAFKPFVYAAAFNKGYTPETVVFDLATQFDTNCQNNPKSCYTPVNYDGRYRGPISLREALAQSINVPAIKVLYLAGLNYSINLARDLGISTLGDANQYGLPLVLGGGEVTLLDMTVSYGTFATEGNHRDPSRILRVEDLQGRALEEFQNKSRNVLPANTARLISDVLSDNQARTPSFGANSPLYFAGRDVAAKTGTTNDYRDAWVMGYTPELVVGAWAGNNDNSPMSKNVAGYIIAPLWRSFFEQALNGKTTADFVIPEPTPKDLKPILRGLWQGGQNYFIDKISGKLATEHTPAELIEERVVSDIHSILYWVDKNNPRDQAPTQPEKDPQFRLWEEPVQAWASLQNLVNGSSANTVIPTEFDDIHGPDLAPSFKINQPQNNREYSIKESLTVELEFKPGRFPIDKVEFFLNNTYLGSSRSNLERFSLPPEDLVQAADIETSVELRVVVYDSVKNRNEKTVAVELAD